MLDRHSPFGIAAPPAPESLNVVAIQRLTQALTTCEIAPGAVFSEAEVAARFGLGRAAVRVALTTLAAAGSVVRLPRQGWRASPITGALVGDVLTARRRLEPALASHPTPERDLPLLRSLARIGAAAAASGDRKALSTARTAERRLMSALAARTGFLIARWLEETWSHAARIIHCLDAEGDVIWPTNREPLVTALGRGDASTALREIERDIACFERAAVRALLSPSPLFQNDKMRRSARRRRERGADASPLSAISNREAGP